jgi:hypothetical protein
MDTTGTGTDTINPNDPVDLAHLDGSFITAEATTSGTAPPDGKYQVNVEKAEIARSKTDNAPMLKWTLKIIAPNHIGRLMWRYNMLSTPENMKWLKGDLQTCGLQLDKVSNLQSRLIELLDVKLEVTKRTRGEHENIYFNKKLVLDDVEGAAGVGHGGQVAGGFDDGLPF